MDILIGALATATLMLIAVAMAFLLWQRRGPSPNSESLDTLAATAASLVTAQADLGGRLSQMS